MNGIEADDVAATMNAGGCLERLMVKITTCHILYDANAENSVKIRLGMCQPSSLSKERSM